jgi:hypothetical protein
MAESNKVMVWLPTPTVEAAKAEAQLTGESFSGVVRRLVLAGVRAGEIDRSRSKTNYAEERRSMENASTR